PMLQPQLAVPPDASSSRPVDPMFSAAASPLAPSLPAAPKRQTATSGDTASAPGAPTTPLSDGPPSPAADLSTPPAADSLSRATSDLRMLADAKPVLPQATPGGSSASTSAAAPHQPQPGLPDTTTATLATPPVAPERVPTPDHAG